MPDVSRISARTRSFSTAMVVACTYWGGLRLRVSRSRHAVVERWLGRTP